MKNRYPLLNGIIAALYVGAVAVFSLGIIKAALIYKATQQPGVPALWFSTGAGSAIILCWFALVLDVTGGIAHDARRTADALERLSPPPE